MSAHLRVSAFDSSHAFLSREDGMSEGIYQGLNCGPGSHDAVKSVAENRKIAAKIISGDRETPVLSCYQVHGNTAVFVTEDWGDNRPKADAMVTNQPGLILGILTADCTPILFEDSAAGVIGAAHAGWKGAADGIIDSTISLMEAHGAQRARIVAAIGPTIQQASYEVGTDFYIRFTDADPDWAAFFTSGNDKNHFQFDLPGFVTMRLKSAGLSQIVNTSVDTYTSGHHFSYRRTTHRKETDYGRQLSAIMLSA
ncbi:peptidoglycan editing factor PgeF [Kordiimonas aestuarii]|uniref:peptidoglycan editing factor PgeF n=1 Tax=Kordiimonas aestuarii TaxID=1005925 RepID=UPI0021CE4777|nr:peptidoglycan editing factor PgeF [Kordiimonas aestuarii]